MFKNACINPGKVQFMKSICCKQLNGFRSNAFTPERFADPVTDLAADPVDIFFRNDAAYAGKSFVVENPEYMAQPVLFRKTEKIRCILHRIRMWKYVFQVLGY